MNNVMQNLKGLKELFIDTPVGDLKDFIKEIREKFGKESKESKIQFQKDREDFIQKFNELSLDDKEGMVDFMEFMMEDGRVVNINMADEKRQEKIQKMSDFLLRIPQWELVNLYKWSKEKITIQKALTQTMNTPEKKN